MPHHVPPETAARRQALRDAAVAARETIAALQRESSDTSTLREAQDERARLVREHLDLDLSILRQACGSQDPVLDEETVAGVEFLAGFADHDTDSVLSWLTSHPGGPEALLGLVGGACVRGWLPSPVDAAFAVPLGAQVRTLSVVANALGRERLVRLTQRRIAAVEGALADAVRDALWSVSPGHQGRQMKALSGQYLHRLAAMEAILARHQGALAWLTTP